VDVPARDDTRAQRRVVRSIEDRLSAAGLPPLPRLAWLEIDTDALASNLRVVRERMPPGTRVAAVVKSDGYGHGIEIAARTFASGGADMLAVATLDEALALRACRVRAPLLVMFTIPPGEIARASAAGLELVAADEDTVAAHLDAWRAARDRQPARARVDKIVFHLEIETGLGRAGIRPERAADVARAIHATPGAELGGIWSHLASAGDVHLSAEQIARLGIAIASLESAGIRVPAKHIAATGALFAGSAPAWDLVRVGLALYGVLPEPFPIAADARAAADALRPAMTLKARALRIEDVPAGTTVGYGGTWRADRASVIATLPVGYGDGWVRAYGGIASALVRGRRVPLVGTIAMDAMAADVSDVPGVTRDDEFVLLGEQGSDRITAAELARLRNTISWEVLSGMSTRLPRVYHAAAGLMGLRTLLGETLAEVEP
jgi:alanine racemase